MTNCPCGSGNTYSACCEPLIHGTRKAATAEALMRSRYSAYVKQEIPYIQKTHDPETRETLDLQSTRDWAADSEWLGLEIVGTENGGESDAAGTVEFIARYKKDGEETEHHEVSRFVKKAGQWFFNDGRAPQTTVIRDSPKVGRNDPCPCGSGKKYKKCCGR